MRIVFMGTPDFAKESLEKLICSGHEVKLVVTPPDKPKGRGMKLLACPVKEYAIQENLYVLQPDKINEIKDEIISIKPDLIVVVAYGKILPEDILKIPKYGCINVHPSLLPKYRGSAPIQWAVINGDKETGTTIMKMSEEMDAGDIILQTTVEIDENENMGELWNRLSKISSELLVEAIKKIENGSANYTKQGKEYTLAPRITKDMAKINWTKYNSVQLKNLIRGLNPILGAYCNLGQKKIKLWNIDIVQEEVDKNIEPGTVILSDTKKGLYVKTIDGAISILEIQGENSKKMNIQDFLRGNKIEIGEKLS